MELNSTERRVLRRATALVVAGAALRLVCAPTPGDVGWQPPPTEKHFPGAKKRSPEAREDSPVGNGVAPPSLSAHRRAVAEATRQQERAETPLAPGERISLNSAPAAELQRLRGIGPVLAERILAERRRRGGFRRVEELLEVSGIGPRTLARIRHHITLP